MEQTSNLALPYLAPSQAQKHVLHNEALRMLDALVQMSVLSADLGTPPGAPADGDCYIVGPSATDAWEDQESHIAARQDGAWTIFEPRAGWTAWNADAGRLLTFDGTGWTSSFGDTITMARIGVNTEADDTNRLAVKSDSVLFSHDDTTPGSGDQRLAINKAASANTASVLFQTGWSGRAEFGLAGDDDWHVKVSADGATWREAIVVDGATGKVAFPSGVFGLRESLSANRTYYVRTDGSDGNDGLSNTSGGAFLTIQKAFDAVSALDIVGYSVTISVAAGSYAGAVNVAASWLGTGTVIVTGDTSTPSNCLLNVTGNAVTINNGRTTKFQGFKVVSTSGNFIVRGQSGLTLDKIVFGGGTVGIACSEQSLVAMNAGTFTVSANYGSILTFDTGGMGNIYASTWTFSGTPAWSTAFVYMTGLSYCLASGSVSFAGAATGKRYYVTLNSGIVTGGGGASYFPGDVSGSTATGGQYV